MASSNKGKTGPGPPLKQMRSGTVNSGYEYEHLIPAYFALELIKDENVKSFEFEINSSSFRKFDDLIIKVTTNKVDDIVEHLALQLKHRECGRDNLQAEREFMRKAEKNKEKGFNISGYLDAFKGLKKDEKDKYKFLLFTNAEFSDLQNVKDYKINRVKPFKTNFFNTDGILQFQERVSSTNKNFYDRFFLVSKQKNVDEIRDAINRTFTQDFYSTVEKANSYITFFQQLRKGSYGDTKITRDAVILNLINILLSDLKISPPVTKQQNNGIDIIEQAMNRFDITLLPNLDASFIEKYWKYTSRGPTPECVTKLAQLKLLQTNDALNEEVNKQMLCFFEEKPLFIQVTEKSKETVLSCVCLLKTLETWKISLVLVGHKIEDNELTKYKVFRNLHVLRCHNSVYEKFIQNFKVSLQGRKAISIKSLSEEFGFDFDEFITPNEIVQLLKGGSMFGKQLEQLPKFHIHRTLLTQKINFDNFINTCDKYPRPIVLHCCDNVDFFKQVIRSKTKFDILDVTADKDINSGLSMKPTIILHHQPRCKNETICCHHFKLGPENSIEYMDSEIDPKTATIFDRQLNILCAESGFGKTTMMKYLAQNCPSGYWVVNVPLQQITSTFKEEHAIENTIGSFVRLSTREKEPVDQRVSKYCLENKKIIFFFDGLDELNNNISNIAIEVIKNMAKQGFKIWISCSERLKTNLEGLLGVYCIYTIKEITRKDQEEYIQNRLKDINVKEKIKNEIINKILRKSEEKEYAILKMPLVLYILTENLSHLDDTKDSIEDLDRILSLNTMYASFIKGKLWHKVKGLKDSDKYSMDFIIEGFKNYYFEGCQLAALQTCLDEDVCQLLQIRLDKKFLTFVKKHNYNLGIVKVKAEDTFSFVHHTFAEYFAAIWLSDNFKSIPVEARQFILKPKYTGIRRFFDVRMAKDCPLHLAVIDQDVSRIEQNIHNPNLVDEGGRTPLHLAVSLGRKHLLLNKEKTRNMYFQTPATEKTHLKVLKCLQDTDPLKEDELLECNCFQYADAALCLSSLEELTKRGEFHWKYLKTYGQHLHTLSFYCITMGYINLLKAAVKEKGLQYFEKLHKGVPLLGLALKNDQKDVATFLLNEGVSLEQTALHEAATWGNFEAAEILLKKVDIEAKDSSGRTALQLAAKMGHISIVKLFVENGADINTTDTTEITPLQRASLNGRTEIVKYLIDNDSEINGQNIYKGSALQKAVEMGHYHTVKCLIENGADKDITDRGKRTPLHYAAYEGHNNITQLLVDHKVNTFAKNEDGKTAKQIAEERGHQTIVEILKKVETSNTKSVKTNFPLSDLHKAAEEDDLNTIKQLLRNGANIEETNNNQETILHIAASRGNTQIIKYLLSQSANPAASDNDSRVPLHLACQNGHLTAVQELINKGQNNARDRWNITPLHRAAYKGHLEIVKMLVDSEVDLFIENNDGQTVLHTAAKGGQNHVIKYLISQGMSVEITDKRKDTCLHYAARSVHTETVKYLSENYKSILNETDNAGRTALHGAVEKGNKCMMEILLAAGADVGKMNIYKQTALDIAKDRKLEDLVLILEAYSKK